MTIVYIKNHLCPGQARTFDAVEPPPAPSHKEVEPDTRGALTQGTRRGDVPTLTR